MTLLTGASTSGKVTIAYKTLACAQQAYPKQMVALVDLHATADPDYLTRVDVDTLRLLLVRPVIDRQAVDVLVDLATSRKVRLLYGSWWSIVWLTAKATRWYPVHPHACGDNVIRFQRVCGRGGSPPRVWGQPQGIHAGNAGGRFTPTRVGTT